MFSVSVCFDSAVDGVEMSHSRWKLFRDDVMDTFDAVLSLSRFDGLGVTVERADGVGSWGDVSVPNCRVVAYGFAYASDAGMFHDFLASEHLPGLCVDYEQDAIALTFGEDSLIGKDGVLA